MSENMDMAARIAELEAENEQLRKTIRTRDHFIRRTMGAYVTDEVLEHILAQKDGLTIGGERRVVTMMFTDLRQSTELSEQLSATGFIRLLNHYLEEMIEIINAWQGNILEFVGDAIVVVYGAPRPNEDAAWHAVASAVAMQRRMGAVNAWNRTEGYPEISMGIGIHTGEAILGNIGSETRVKYDMIGRNVNLASRIEGFTRGGQILVSTETFEAAREYVVENESGALWVQPKGIQDKILIHDIVGCGSQRLPAYQ